MHTSRALIALALGLIGCTGESSSSGRVAPALTPQLVTGSVTTASEGTLVHLVRPTSGAQTMVTLADAVLDSVEVEGSGAFALEAREPGPWRVLFSGPGFATTWIDVPDASARVRIEPALEARLDLLALDPSGAPEEMALALVLTPEGAPLPLSVEESLTRPDGRASIGRLPAGRVELIALAADLSRAARVTVEASAGQTSSLELRLVEDLPLQARALRILGHDQLADLMDMQVTR